MRYTSTRADLDIDFATVVASGLAPGGGLYLPQIWPHIDQAELERLGAGSYAQALAFVGGLFDGGALSAAAWADIARKALAGFRHSAIAPLNQLGAHHWLLELFHGPTLSFKDYGLQPLSQLLAALSAHKARKLFILGATSGDTGSAAIAAFRGQPGARIVILHPHGRVSEVQRRQMTTVDDANVLNLAVEGSFDDCQRFAKALLAERAERPDEAVLSVNSINWGRLLFQTAYYVFIGAQMARAGRPFAVAVPSGNFGNALSALIAAKMGVPIRHLIVATNANDALSRIFTEGKTTRGPVRQTLSPAMDIQIPSNLERLLFLLNGCDAVKTAAQMADMVESGHLALPQNWADDLPFSLEAHAVDDAEILQTIRETFARTDRIIDPHTAVAVAAAHRAKGAAGCEVLSVSTAHPAKFPDAVEQALGFAPPVPEPLARVYDAPERFDIVSSSLDAVRAAIG